MRPILTSEEIQALIQSIPQESTIWIEDERARRSKYQAIIAGGDRQELVALIKTLNERQDFQREKGKKLNLNDERFLRDSEKILHQEIGYVLDMTADQVVLYLTEQLN